MIPVGDRLRHERETRDTSIDQLAEATGIGLPYLQAMERSDYDALPGRAFGKLYVRAYAEVLEFDPQPLIEQYDREQQTRMGVPAAAPRPEPAGARPVAAAIARWRESKAADRIPAEPAVESGAEPAVQPAGGAVGEPAVAETAEAPPHVRAVTIPEPPLHAPAANRRIAVPVSLMIAVIVLVIAVYVVGSKVREAPTLPRASELPPAIDIGPEPPPPVPEPSPTVSHPPAPRASPPGALTVAESNVGRRLVGSKLEGDGSQFAPGDVAWFQTRVMGGRAGETIRHVWIHDGRIQQAITLRVGGADWRTHSNKTIYRPGPWTVEARDGDGRILATAAFLCVPVGR